ncbi:metallophosphoesterase [Candidatus Pacearchaeota archaeon]|nr:metallophosphoesterase [Candidatus Pacearchaeota archaeon]
MKIDFVGKCLLLDCGSERTLAIGDLHLGYEGAMRRSGVMIPVKLFEKSIVDFDKIISETGELDNIVILGDLKHEFGSILPDEWKYIIKFIEYVKSKCKKLIVIEGNHDVILFPLLKKMNIEGVDFFVWKNVVFTHGDKEYNEMNSKKIDYWVLGHGHPAINLYDGNKKEKYKCFLYGNYKDKEVIVVPSFFPLIEGTDAREFDMKFAWDFNLKKFRSFVVSDDLKVLDFGELGKIRTD